MVNAHFRNGDVFLSGIGDLLNSRLLSSAKLTVS